MSKVVFVVNMQDFSYDPPMVKIKYAGDSIVEAQDRFDRAVTANSNCRVTLDAVEDTYSKRLFTKEADR